MRISRTFWLTVLVALAVVVPFVLFGDAVDAAFARWRPAAAGNRPLAALVLIALLVADIVIPVPSSLVSTVCGAVLGFVGGLLTSFAGMTLSAVAGYGLGRWASGRALRWLGGDEAATLTRLQARFGIGFLVAMRPVPVLAEASALFAGLTKQPFLPALAALLVGNLGVSAVYAAVGAWGGEREEFLGAFGVAILLTGAAMLVQRRALSRK
jgi:uncharacterized membrane protein YdjX (TVP38/TMEM64 family)